MPTLFKPALQRQSEEYFGNLITTGLGLPAFPRRLVDDLVLLPRLRPMKVICLGMSRTGTFSLFTALTMLGYNPYHMKAAMDNAAVDMPCWQQALDAKYHGKGKPWGREEFDKLLGDFDAVLDVPCILLAEELIKAYPEAKIIVTERSVDDWIRSVQGTVGPVWAWNWRPVAWSDPAVVGPWMAFASKIEEICPFTACIAPEKEHLIRDFYKQHYERLRAACPEERTLNFTFDMGFKGLCEFLEEPVLDQPYPNVNDSAFFVKFHAIMWWDAAYKAVAKVAGGSAVVVVIGMLAARGLGYSIGAGGIAAIGRLDSRS